MIPLMGQSHVPTSMMIGSGLQRDGNRQASAPPVQPNDSSQSLPCNSVRRAVEQASPGTTIVLQGGSYPERLTIGHLSNQKNLTITAQRGPALIGGFFVGAQEICIPVTQQEGTTITLSNCSQPPGVHAKLYYPAVAPGDSPVSCGGPFPLVVYAHGRRSGNLCDWSQPGPISEDYRQADALLTRVAALGIIALSVDVSVGEISADASVLINALAYVLNENDRIGSRLHQAVTLGRIGLIGHSTGGAASIRVASCLNGRCRTGLTLPRYGNTPLRIAAVALLAPGLPDALEGKPEDMNAPVLVIYGTNDTQQVRDDPLTVYGEAKSPKHLVLVTGANHFGFTDGLCIAPPDDAMSQVGGAVGGPAAQALQQRAAADYLEAFFSYYLPYLLPDPSKLDYLRQQGGQQCGKPGKPPACGSPVRRFADLDSLNVAVSVCSCSP